MGSPFDVYTDCKRKKKQQKQSMLVYAHNLNELIIKSQFSCNCRELIISSPNIYFISSILDQSSQYLTEQNNINIKDREQIPLLAFQIISRTFQKKNYTELKNNNL